MESMPHASDQARIQIPPAPHCPPWCTVDHAAQPGHRDGWDHVEATEAVKTCRRHIGTAEAENGAREFDVAVDRFATADAGGMRVDAPKVVINQDADLMPSAARYLADALTSAAALADGPDELPLCDCGKPLEHVNAPEDSAEWACRMPDAAAAGVELNGQRQLVTLGELAEYTGISAATWRLLDRLGVGPQSLRVAGRPVWLLAEVDDWRHRADPTEVQKAAIGRVLDAFREVGLAFDWYLDRHAVI